MCSTDHFIADVLGGSEAAQGADVRQFAGLRATQQTRLYSTHGRLVVLTQPTHT